MDELERRLRAAAPTPILGERASATLESILERSPDAPAAPPAAHRPARRFGLLMAAASFVLLVVIVVGFTVTARPQASLAVTPPPLLITPTDTTVADLLDALRRAPVDGEPRSSERLVETEGWYAQLEMVESLRISFVQPQRVRFEWSQDLSGTMILSAGTPFPGMETELGDRAPEPLPDGQVIREEVWAPGELSTWFPDPPPATVDTMREYLAAPMPEGTAVASTDYFALGEALLHSWTLGTLEERAMLEVLLSSENVTVAGTTVDRAGREGVVLAFAPSASDPLGLNLLVVDVGTWRVLASERSAAEDLDDVGVREGAVLSYTLWGVPRPG